MHSATQLSNPQSQPIPTGSMIPGLTLTMLLALLGHLLAERVTYMMPEFGPLPVSPIVIAILLGMLIRNVTGIDASCRPGIKFSQSRILQIGIVLLGIRLGFSEAAVIGISSIPLIVATIGIAILMISLLGRRLGLTPQLATLIAAGTSICGATAIVTIAPIISARDHEVSYAIACITVFGIVATLTYPLAAHWVFAGNAHSAGLFLGTAVHDTAQVVGAGMIYQNLFNSAVALDTATITKLVRNLSMLIVIPLLSISFQRHHNTAGSAPHWTKLIPLFIVGFALMSMLRTIGDMGSSAFGFLPIAQWEMTVNTLTSISGGCLLIAMAAVGLSTNLASFKQVGLKPLALGLAAAITTGLLSGTLIHFFY